MPTQPADPTHDEQIKVHDEPPVGPEIVGPRITVTASVVDGDERYGLEILVNGVNQPQEARDHVEVVDVSYDDEVTVRPRLYPREADQVLSPEQRAEETGEFKGYVRGDDEPTGEVLGATNGGAEAATASRSADAAREEQRVASARAGADKPQAPTPADRPSDKPAEPQPAASGVKSSKDKA
jgi:hypothetical protein